MTSDTEWPVPQRPMTLGTIYTSTAKLSLRTAARGLTSAVVILLPLYALFGATARGFFLNAVRVVEQYASKNVEASPELMATMLGDILGGATIMFLTGILVAIGVTIAQVLIVTESWDHAVGAVRTVRGWIVRSTGRPLGSALAQLVIMLFIVSGLFFAIALLAAVVSGFTGEFGASLVTYSAVVVIVYFALGTAFRLHEIVADDRGPWRSLISSLALSRPNWWKLFASVIPMLVVFYVLSEALMRLIPGGPMPPPVADASGSDLNTMAELYREMAGSFTPAHVLGLGAIGAISQFLVINLLTAVYVDFRARRGDFDFDEAEQIEEAME